MNSRLNELDIRSDIGTGYSDYDDRCNGRCVPDDDNLGCAYDVIVVGAGAAGLFYAAADSMHNTGSSKIQEACDPAVYNDSDIRQTGTNDAPGRKLILEKTQRAGQKLLMSGNGMCNITHSGSIKDFIGKYGENGRLIRSCLYRHNNIEFMDMMERLGVHLTVREDGKVFPETMRSRDVLDALMRAAESGGWDIRYNAEVTAIMMTGTEPDRRPADYSDTATEPGSRSADYRDTGIEADAGEALINVELSDGTQLTTRKLVIACGGSSYPSTGSDGSLLRVLSRDLGVAVKEPHPALTPIFVQDFRFGGISGVTLPDVVLKCGDHEMRGPMLMTHKGFSGPAVLHMSQYVKTGDTLTTSFIPDKDRDTVARELKAAAPGNKTGAVNFIASEYGLPRSLVELLLAMAAPRSAASDSNEVSIAAKRMSSLSGREMDLAAEALTQCTFSVSGTGGWNDAMVTAGGVALSSIDLKTMRLKDTLPDIRIIGEVLDVNGDTGGYNLQFAYSSAMAAL